MKHGAKAGWPRVGRAMSVALAVVVGVWLAGCATPDRAQPGTSRAETIDRFGHPTLAMPLAQPPGGERLIYSYQPYARHVYGIDLDAQGRVVRAQQMLTERQFNAIQTDVWTREDVLRSFGPPGEFSRVANFQGDIWTYRWSDGLWMLYHIYIDPQGIVRRAHPQVELIDGDGDSRSD